MTIGTIFCSQCGGESPSAAQFCSHCGATLAGAPPASNRAVVPDTALAPPQNAQYAPLAVPAPNALLPNALYGGFWVRFVAAVIDGIIVQAVVMPVAFMVGLVIGVAGAAMSTVGQSLNLAAILIGGVFGFFGSWLYEASMESTSRQATLGKMVLGLKVTDLGGNRISFAQATARHFCKYLSAMILFLGYIMAGFTERKQALHDMIAGTLVRRS